MPFSEMWVELETVKQSEISQKEKEYHIISLICGILEIVVDELTCQTEILEIPRREGGSEMNWEIEIDIIIMYYTLLCIVCIINYYYVLYIVMYYKIDK